MKKRNSSSLFARFLGVFVISCVPSVAKAQPARYAFRPWSCDALTPNLCDLTADSSYITMRGGIQVKYWRYSNKLGTTSNPPLIVIHGGPGYPHDYLLPLKQVACTGNREVIFYDQAGCGESKLPNNNNHNTNNGSVAESYPWLLNPDYYALEELERLIQGLGIGDYHLLGNSWGTILAQIFALNSVGSTRENMLSMSLSGCISDTQLYIQSQWNPIHGTLGRLPPFVQDRIRTLEEAKMYDSAEYQALDEILTSSFTLRTAPFPDCFLKSTQTANQEIYVAMQGPSEFTMSGVLADFNVTGRLHELSDLPVLLTTGAFDTVRPIVAETMQRQLPLSERVLFYRSGHITELDEAGKMNAVVSDFLARVETAKSLNVPFVPQQSMDMMTAAAAAPDADSSEHSGGMDSSSTTLNGNALNSSWILFILSVAGVASLGFFLGGVLVGFMISNRYRTRQGYQVIGGQS